MKKNLLSVLIVIAMVMALCTGCGSENSASTAEPTPVSSAEAVTETSAPVAEEPYEEPSTAELEESSVQEPEEPENLHQYNFPGSDIALLDYTNVYEMPLCEETTTISWMRNAVNLMGPLANIGINSFQDFDYIQYLQEITNVQIDFIELDFFTSQEQMNLYIASGDYADIISDLNYTGEAIGALNDEIIIDLTDRIAEYAPNYDYLIHSNSDYTAYFYTDGKLLYFSSPYENYINNQGLVIRSDWLEELEMEIPTTYDELHDVLTAFQSEEGASTPIYMHEDCNITGLGGGYNVAGFAAGGTASTLGYYVEDGVVKSTLTAENYRDYLVMLNQWYTEGLIDHDFINIENDPFSSYLSGQITSDQMGVWCTSTEGIDTYTVPITPMPNPTINEDGIEHITNITLLADSTNTYITSCCENVETAMRLVDFFYSEDGIMFYNYGFEGTDYELDENNTPYFSDAVMNNEYGLTPSNFMRLRCGYGVFSSLLLRYRTAAYNTDLANEAWDVWTSNLDGSMALPTTVHLSTEETETSSYYSSDICTYASQMIPQFVLGDIGFDQWDSFAETLYDMNIQVCIDAQQAAYDRVVNS